jgi:DNA-binding NtrC family response regulator
VLLVEDEEMVRRFAARALARHGLRVIEAESPEQALAILEREPGELALLITDVVMPGMSGVELAERVKRQRPSLPVLYMSGYPANMLVPDGRTDGEARLLAKPFTTAQLLADVQDLLSD